MWYAELKICMGDKQHRYYKHTKFHQNLRGSLQLFVDWAYTVASQDSPDTVYICPHPWATYMYIRQIMA